MKLKQLLITETAGLLPAKYISNIRRSKSKWDVRQNLLEHNKEIKGKYGNHAGAKYEDDTKDYQSDQPYGGADNRVGWEEEKEGNEWVLLRVRLP